MAGSASSAAALASGKTGIGHTKEERRKKKEGSSQ
jgi:hypothetical protein